jgi:hypothetical protein
MRQHRSGGVICGLVAFGLLTSLVSITDRAQAASGNGPYYAEPSWDQKLLAATRFVVLTDSNSEAVLDRNTGLVWEKSPNKWAYVDWSKAKLQCINKNIGGQKGWRLPAVAELASLLDRSVAAPGPTLPPGHPFVDVYQEAYWSASTFAENPSNAWYVSFYDSKAGNADKDLEFHAWCVRGGSNAEVH